MTRTARDNRTVSVEPITSLDERYISNSVMYRAMMASITLFLDGPALRNNRGELDHEAIRARVDAASWSIPALRKRLRLAPLGFSAAAWVPVEQLDLDYHVRFRAGVLDEGPESAEVLSGRSEGPLDRGNPVWRILFVELESGDVALVFTWHHVMGDASYGGKALLLLCDHIASDRLPLVTQDQRDALGHAPASGLAMLYRLGADWWASHPSPAERWSAYRSRPFTRRVRRWGARLARPLRDRAISLQAARFEIPPRVSRMMRFNLAQSKRLADRLGGSLNDLTVAVAIKALFDTRPGLEEAALLVPISRRRRQATGEARNVMTAVRVSTPAGLSLGEIVDSVRAQVRRGAFSRDPVSTDARLGYATMVPSGETDLYFGGARTRAIAGWPVGDPRDDVGVLATSYDDVVTVAVTTAATTDIDSLVAAITAILTESEAPV